MSSQPQTYRRESGGYAFILERAEVDRLKKIPDFENREEPAVADEFLRFRAESWAEALADAGAGPGEFSACIDPHQRKVHLVREGRTAFSADL
jgi:hypothetical protein